MAKDSKDRWQGTAISRIVDSWPSTEPKDQYGIALGLSDIADQQFEHSQNNPIQTRPNNLAALLLEDDGCGYGLLVLVPPALAHIRKPRLFKLIEVSSDKQSD